MKKTISMLALFVLLGVLALALFWFSSQSGKMKAKRQEQKNLEAYRAQFDEDKSSQVLEKTLTDVAGTAYTNENGTERQQIISTMTPGETLLLVPDSNNPFDKDAVKVMRLNGEQVGFLNMDLAMEIRSRLLKRSRVDARVVSIQGKPKNVTIELIKYQVRAPKPVAQEKKKK